MKTQMTRGKPYRNFRFTVLVILSTVILSACSSLDTNQQENRSSGSALVNDSTTSNQAQETLSSVQETEDYNQVTASMRGINIGNALEAPSPGDWGVTIKEEYFQAIEAAGFNTVRIPVRFSGYTGADPDYLIQNEIFDIVDNVIQWALENELTVILDLHHFEEFIQDPEAEQDRFLAIWEQISAHYKDMPPEVYFELLNEPNTNVTASFWNELVEECVAIIRESNPTRKILVGGIDFSDIDSLYLLELPDDENLIATFHFYEPFEFTHQGASWVSDSSDWLGITWNDTTSERQEINKLFDQALEWSNLYEVPLIMGEFGVISTADQTSRQDWIRFVAQDAEARGIGWVLWVLCSDFGIYDCQNETWDEAILNALMGQD